MYNTIYRSMFNGSQILESIQQVSLNMGQSSNFFAHVLYGVFVWLVVSEQLQFRGESDVVVMNHFPTIKTGKLSNKMIQSLTISKTPNMDLKVIFVICSSLQIFS